MTSDQHADTIEIGSATEGCARSLHGVMQVQDTPRFVLEHSNCEKEQNESVILPTGFQTGIVNVMPFTI